MRLGEVGCGVMLMVVYWEVGGGYGEREREVAEIVD